MTLVRVQTGVAGGADQLVVLGISDVHAGLGDEFLGHAEVDHEDLVLLLAGPQNEVLGFYVPVQNAVLVEELHSSFQNILVNISRRGLYLNSIWSRMFSTVGILNLRSQRLKRSSRFLPSTYRPITFSVSS